MPQLLVGGTEQGLVDAITEARGLQATQAMARLGEIAKACHGALPLWSGYFTQPALHNYAADAIGYIKDYTGGEPYITAQIAPEIARIDGSNLLNICKANLRGELNSPLWHDFGDSLAPSLNLGISGNTMNPLLVWEAVERSREAWLPRLHELWRANPSFQPEAIGLKLTTDVVKVHADLLRPIYDITGGRQGYVSLQLSPTCAFDCDAMLEQSITASNLLRDQGIPNVIFKVPGTKAGHEVIGEIMTATGMATNVTINYMLGQQFRFAEAIELVGLNTPSCLTQMNGRLAGAIIAELEQPGSLGKGNFDPVVVQMWSMHLVRQLAYRELYDTRGYQHSQPLGAAGRGPWDIDLSLNNGRVPTVMTLFPPRQEEYDTVARTINPEGLWTPIPDDAMALMMKSEVFRLAISPDAQPDTFDTFPATVSTLQQFGEKYAAYLEWVEQNKPA